MQFLAGVVLPAPRDCRSALVQRAVSSIVLDGTWHRGPEETRGTRMRTLGPNVKEVAGNVHAGAVEEYGKRT